MITQKVDADIKQNLMVRQVEGYNSSAWEQYVAENPDATFYHRIEWKNIIEKSFGHKTYYLMAMDNDKVVGILPLVHIKSLIFGSIFCSMPFLNFGGVCADTQGTESLLLKEAEMILKKNRGDYLELRHLKLTSASLPCKSHKVSMTIELNPDPEIVWNQFDRKHRSNVRRAAKNGLEVKYGKGELLPEFYNVMCRGWKELGTPIYAYSFLENIVEALGDSIEIFLVSYEGKAVAASFIGYNKDTVEGMWLSSLHEYAKLQAGYVLYWEMIRQACEKGYRQFHLGRSTMESGGELFKKKWNATPKPLYWEYILNNSKEIPELNVENPKYQRAIEMWRKLPQNVTNFIGPHLAKNIP
jgi:FemAB-related protein (PEP-CTERM system-associated)